MPQPIEVTRLAQAIEQFRGRAPRDLPDGVLDSINDIYSQLTDTYPDMGESPGKQAAKSAGLAPGTDGTGEHYSKAAQGPDGPSPGQREVQQIAEAAEKLRETVGAGESAET